MGVDGRSIGGGGGGGGDGGGGGGGGGGGALEEVVEVGANSLLRYTKKSERQRCLIL